ncbi:MAG TPA: sulfotransferase [Steroidobacteraceae bacterium]|nr:sulfotransferase [Steroidobacteraceae bacterium]
MSTPSAAPEAEALRLMRAGRLAEALGLAEQAVAAKTACSPAHGVLATILLQLGRPAEAEAALDKALEYERGTAEAYAALAYVSAALGRHEQASTLYRRASRLGPNVPGHWFNLASSERALGRLEEAEDACDRAIALNPREYRGYLLRSELRLQTAAANHVEQLRGELARSGLPDSGRVLLGYALGKELDDLGEYEEAFSWFALAAKTRRRHLAYEVAADVRQLQRIAEAFPRGGGGTVHGPDDSHRFVFIFGLPRSGTTLLERILTSLPGVRSNGESEHFARALLRAAFTGQGAADRGAPDVVARTAAADWDAVAAGYLRLADPGGAREVIIEKLPLNYLYLGAIHRALPQARLVLVSRSTLDVCFAMYCTLFGEAYPFSYDFQDLARYYAAYSRLIAHWRDAFGESIHDVGYEELVSDPVRVGASVARFCGLEWRDSAVQVERNSAVCLTQSSAQVRRPIHRASTARWRHYRTQLEPLIEALRRQGVKPAGLD